MSNLLAASTNIEQHTTDMGHLTATTSVVYDNINNHIIPVSKDIIHSEMINNNINNNNKIHSQSNGDVKHLDNNNDINNINNNHNNNNNQNNNNNNSINNNNCENGEIKKKNGHIFSEINDDEPKEYNYFGFKVGAKLKWPNIIGIIIIHSLFVYVFFDGRPKPRNIWTYVWGFLMGGIGGFGVTGGVHRLWSHRSYKAKTPLRIILMLCFSLSGQNTIYDWVRDHRVHHKFSETEADPHNSNRGFFFAHIGWLMMNKHPEVVRKGRMLDMSDIENDPVVQFHQKYFIPLKLLLCFFLPTAIPMYFWKESFFWAFYSQCVLRYVFNLNFTWLVNSAAHMWGTRPYDNRINPVQNLSVSIVAMGEGWHNYHHVFPWDYKAAELGHYFNITTFWIELFAKIGWAYDLKQPSQELIKNTIVKYGDNTHVQFGHHMTEVPPPESESDKTL